LIQLLQGVLPPLAQLPRHRLELISLLRPMHQEALELLPLAVRLHQRAKSRRHRHVDESNKGVVNSFIGVL
jgi:hypothetical protein